MAIALGQPRHPEPGTRFRLMLGGVFQNVGAPARPLSRKQISPQAVTTTSGRRSRRMTYGRMATSASVSRWSGAAKSGIAMNSTPGRRQQAEAGSQPGRPPAAGLLRAVARAPSGGTDRSACSRTERVSFRVQPAERRATFINAPMRGERRGRVSPLDRSRVRAATRPPHASDAPAARATAEPPKKSGAHSMTPSRDVVERLPVCDLVRDRDVELGRSNSARPADQSGCAV